jgi:hypothetical protein
MAGVITRLFRHLSAADARNRFPATAMDRIAAEIGAGELQHGGQICFAVESALHWRDVIHDVSANRRARDAFTRLRVWDTEANNGVLVYLLLADQRIEIVADRGLQGLVSDAQWRGICQRLEEHLRTGGHADAVVEAIKEVGQLLALHFPLAAGVAGQDELPNQPVFL